MIEFLVTLLRLLDRLQIPYAIGGSLASSFYGEPRSTQDIDISIVLIESKVSELTKACENVSFWISPEETHKAILSGGPFSVNDGFWKADLFVITEANSFAAQALRRRKYTRLPEKGDTVWWLAPEDVIIYKLRWCEIEAPDKHLRDIAAVARTRVKTLDLKYIERWAASFNAGGLWAIVLEWAQKQP